MAPRGSALPLSPPFPRSRICMPVTRSALLPAMYGAAGSSRAPAAQGSPPRFNVKYLPVSLFFSFPPFLSSSATWACSPKEGVVQPGGRKAGEVGRRVTRNGKQITCLPGGSQRSSSGGGHGSSEGHGPGEGDGDAAGWHRGAPRGLPRRCALLAAGRRAAWGRRAGPAPHRTRCCCRHGAEASADPRRPPAREPLSTSGRFYALAAAPRSSPRSASTRVTRRSSPPRLPGRSGEARGESRTSPHRAAAALRPQRARTVPFVNRAPRPCTWSASPTSSVGSADDSDRDSPGGAAERGAPRVRGMPRPHGTRTGRPRGVSPLLVAGICADVAAILLST